MIHMANALLALGDSAEARALHDRLAASDMTVGFVHDGNAAITAARRSHPDVVVVGPGLAGPGAMEVLRALKSDAETADIPVFVLTEAPLAETGADLLEAGADDGAAWPASTALIVGRVRPLVRVATMHAELKHRGALFADLGLGAVPTVEADATEPPVLLVVGDREAEAAVAAAVAEAEVVRAPDLIEAQRMMEDRLFDACVMVPHDGEVEAHLDLCLQTRRNARLFNLPVVFAADAGLMPDPARALGMGASHALPGLEPRAELRFALLALVRRQRLRWAIRRAPSRRATRSSVRTSRVSHWPIWSSRLVALSSPNS